MQEQRTSVRTAMHAEISIVRNDAILEHFHARNLSVGGLFIACPAKALSVGDRLRVQFDDIGAGDRDRTYDAVVVHHNEKGVGLAWMNNGSCFWIVLMQLIGASSRAEHNDLVNSARTPGRAGRGT